MRAITGVIAIWENSYACNNRKGGHLVVHSHSQIHIAAIITMRWQIHVWIWRLVGNILHGVITIWKAVRVYWQNSRTVVDLVTLWAITIIGVTITSEQLDRHAAILVFCIYITPWNVYWIDMSLYSHVYCVWEVNCTYVGTLSIFWWKSNMFRIDQTSQPISMYNNESCVLRMRLYFIQNCFTFPHVAWVNREQVVNYKRTKVISIAQW